MATVHQSGEGGGRGTTLRHVALLLLVCLPTYCIGLTDHGLTNWQESQRALVVQEMFARGDWLLPTINEQPYLAKPPMFYWIQLVIAHARHALLGTTPGDWELRFAAALGGLLGVLATYFAARRWFIAAWGFPPARRPESTVQGADGNDRARSAALWTALLLATGFLYARSARIGELDIWIVPFAVWAVDAIFRAWTRWRCTGRTHWVAVACAGLASIGAALTKGPPALLAIAAAGYGGILLHAALERRDGEEARPWKVFPAALMLIFGAGAACFGAFTLHRAESGVTLAPRLSGWMDWAGLVLLVVTAQGLGYVFGRALEPRRAWACFKAFAATHPVGVLGIGGAALWGWGRLVAERIGPENAAAWAQKEAEDNLLVLVAQSPIKNLEALSYGAGLGSLLGLLFLVWLVRRRPRLTPPLALLLAWLFFGFAVYSLLGKGIARYLTPVWPALAACGGAYAAMLLSELRGQTRRRIALAGCVLVLAAGQAWWYGHGRELRAGERSPRAMIRELLSEPHHADPARIASFEFWTAATSVYAGTRVHPIGEMQLRPKTTGGRVTLDELKARIAEDGPWVVLIRARPQPGDPPRPAADRLRDEGFVVEPMTVRSRWLIDGSDATPVDAVRLSLPVQERSVR